MPSNPVKVLVVDDSFVVRRIIETALAGLEDVSVVGHAADGAAALKQIEALDPDLVTLDIEMPVMDGIEAMREIKRRWPRLPVIMFSTLTERGAAMTLEALLAGARDYVTKPTNQSTLVDSLSTVRSELGSRIRALVPQSVATPSEKVANQKTGSTVRTGSLQRATVAASASALQAGVGRQPNPVRVEMLVIGSSTGGPDALTTLLSALPADLPVPVMVVQHMPAIFTRSFAERLDRTVALSVREAKNGDPIRPGTVYIAPGDFHMELVTGTAIPKVRLTQGELENYCRPAVDVLFRSAAAAYGARTLGLVLTGMGADGKQGADAIVKAGGEVYAQDQDTCVVWGMPRAVTEAGLASRVLPLPHIAAALTTRINTGRTGTAGEQS